MTSLYWTLQLLGIPNQKNVFPRLSQSDNISQRHLAGFIDKQRIDRL
jgi:hypothetical protein